MCSNLRDSLKGQEEKSSQIEDNNYGRDKSNSCVMYGRRYRSCSNTRQNMVLCRS